MTKQEKTALNMAKFMALLQS
ncbi:Rop family plasmid primer RNA-binding protein [Klebsiella pneumoniae]